MFKESDIGRLVKLHIDPQKVASDWIIDDIYHVPYDSIIEYSFSSKVRVLCRTPRIITSSKHEKVDTAQVGRGLGAEYFTLEGVIEELNQDYAIIRK